ncbi:phosphopantetheine-binding protein [Micromonospora sp. BRA006-A]|nr:phosphopantetheine-binding protein [Micromonospora sp. BRA006-A]
MTPVEQTVAATWRDVLGVPEVGLDDDFFEMGGHSLLAIRMLACCARRTGRSTSA